MLLKPELLSPAGNMEKLMTALRFGADAVYLAGKRFGMRAAADNFSLEELASAVKYSHKIGKRVYLTVNIMPHEGEMRALYAYLESLKGISLDGLIVADPGVFMAARRILPEIPLHMSTQAATVNSDTCKFWFQQGAQRIVLARELSLLEIEKMRCNIPDELELEVFVHGSMCVSFSGRCMLSEYYTSRDANRGLCTQPCRWEYRFYENKRPDDVLTCEIQPEGSYIFGSKDLCMIEHINDLIDLGVHSLKIEGRMKSAYYAAVTANAYRIALDLNGQLDADEKAVLRRELESVSHREYCSGYFYEDLKSISNIASNSGYIGEKTYLCIVESFDDSKSLYRCKQKNKFYSGQTYQYITPGKSGRNLRIVEMYDENLDPIEACVHPQMTFYIRCDADLKPGDIIRSL